eukprot:symbB.v1.2.027784.t1/scaffold2875.1/size68334/5
MYVSYVCGAREWSKSIELRKSSSIQSDASATTSSDMRRSFLGLHHLTLVAFISEMSKFFKAAAVAVLISLLTCLNCSASTEGPADKESVPFLSVHSDSEPEKGAVPSGVLGFDPRNFKPEKYMSHTVHHSGR